MSTPAVCAPRRRPTRSSSTGPAGGVVATNPEQYLNESSSITAPQRALRIPRTSFLDGGGAAAATAELATVNDLVPYGGVYSSHVKPFLDRALGALLLVLLSPLMVAVAVMIAVRLG